MCQHKASLTIRVQAPDRLPVVPDSPITGFERFPRHTFRSVIWLRSPDQIRPRQHNRPKQSSQGGAGGLEYQKTGTAAFYFSSDKVDKDSCGDLESANAPVLNLRRDPRLTSEIDFPGRAKNRYSPPKASRLSTIATVASDNGTRKSETALTWHFVRSTGTVRTFPANVSNLALPHPASHTSVRILMRKHGATVPISPRWA